MNNTKPKLIKNPDNKLEHAIALCFFASEIRFLKRLISTEGLLDEDTKKYYFQLFDEAEYILNKSRGLK